MKKIILSMIVAAVILPVAAFAGHQRGTFGGFGSNFLSFSVGNQSLRYGHGGNVPFVDERGAAYDYHSLRPGHPITVDYSGKRGHETVSRVTVHQRAGNGGRHGDGHR